MSSQVLKGFRSYTEREGEIAYNVWKNNVNANMFTCGHGHDEEWYKTFTHIQTSGNELPRAWFTIKYESDFGYAFIALKVTINDTAKKIFVDEVILDHKFIPFTGLGETAKNEGPQYMRKVMKTDRVWMFDTDLENMFDDHWEIDFGSCSQKATVSEKENCMDIMKKCQELSKVHINGQKYYPWKECLVITV